MHAEADVDVPGYNRHEAFSGGGNAPLPSTGGHSTERRRASSPWHRSTVGVTNDEQRGKL